jgi:hypothetical protein
VLDSGLDTRQPIGRDHRDEALNNRREGRLNLDAL